jgi:hypothetical protein
MAVSTVAAIMMIVFASSTSDVCVLMVLRRSHGGIPLFTYPAIRVCRI